MPEMINTYTKDGIQIGIIEKSKYYQNTNPDTQPWIKCVTCFVIDEKTNKILFEKRGMHQIDAGKLDLCSGHVRCNESLKQDQSLKQSKPSLQSELPLQCMIRELYEELSIPEDDSRNLKCLGEVAMDYSLLSEERDEHPNLKCLATIYALKMKNISKIKMDGEEVVQMGWLDFDDAIGFVTHNMTRFAYDESSKRAFDNIFDSLKKYMHPELKPKEQKHERVHQ